MQEALGTLKTVPKKDMKKLNYFLASKDEQIKKVKKCS
jgi:hypothetical protein